MDISVDYHKYKEEYSPKEIVEGYFDIPEQFDAIAGFIVEALELFYSQNIRKNEKPTFDHLLDVGCASGKQTVEFRKFFHRITAVDPSEPQIEKAKEAFQNADITFLVASAEHIPADDTSVDVITAVWSFFHFDVKKFVEECHRVLKPRGVAMLFGMQPCKVEPGGEFTIGKKAKADATKLWENLFSQMEEYLKEINHPLWRGFVRFQKYYDDIKGINKSCDVKEFETDVTLSDFKKYYSAIPCCTFPKTKEIFQRFYGELKEQWQVQNMADDDVVIRFTQERFIISLSK